MKKLIIYFSLLLNAVVFTQVNNQVPSDLQKLTKDALTNFPKMHSLDELVKLSSYKASLSTAGYLPIVNVDASYMHLNPVSSVSIPIPGFNQAFQMNPADNYSAMLNVVQPLIDFKTLANIDRAKSDIAVSEATRESYRTQLAYQIAQIYYGIIFINKNISVQNLQLALVKSNLDIINAKLKNGDALTYDLVTAQVRYTNIENLITELKTQLQKQYNLLNMLTCQQVDNTIIDSTFSNAVFDVVRDSVMLTAYQNNNDLIIAQDKVIYSEKDVIAAKRIYLPALNIFAGMGYKNGFAPDIFETKFNYNFGISLNIPVFPASRPYIQTDLAETGLASSKNELMYQKIVLTKDVQNALDEIEKNEKKFKSMDTLLRQANLAVTLATERYKEGVITSVELLTAETNYQDALLSKLQTEYNLLLSKLELNRLAGKKWW